MFSATYAATNQTSAYTTVGESGNGDGKASTNNVSEGFTGTTICNGSTEYKD
jgi:hypothetical protein